MFKQIVLMAVCSMVLAGCFGLPKRGQSPNEVQIKKCECLGNVAISMYGVGGLVALGGFIGGVVTHVSGSNNEAGFIVAGSGWVSGMIGLGILGYMEHYTSCPMP